MPRKKKSQQKIVGYLGDLHVPNYDEEALGMAMEYCLSKRVNQLIVSELPELEKVAYWRKAPGELEYELEICREVVKGITKKFKGIPITYLPGNHDERLINFIFDHAPALAGMRDIDIASQMDLHKYDWTYHDNKAEMKKGNGPLRIGKLSILHGHEIKTSWGAINLAKIYYDRCRSNVLFGHHHRCQEWIVRTITNYHEGAWAVGCLCELNPDWMPHNDWVHGFAVIKFYEDGTFKVKNKKIIEGKLL